MSTEWSLTTAIRHDTPECLGVMSFEQVTAYGNCATCGKPMPKAVLNELQEALASLPREGDPVGVATPSPTPTSTVCFDTNSVSLNTEEAIESPRVHSIDLHFSEEEGG